MRILGSAGPDDGPRTADVTRPVVVGYLCVPNHIRPAATVPIPTAVPVTVSPESVTTRRGAARARHGHSIAVAIGTSAITRFASREGFEIAHIYLDRNAERPRPAFEALIACARDDLRAVIVPDFAHLGSSPAEGTAVCKRIETILGVPVITVRLPKCSGTSWTSWGAQIADERLGDHGSSRKQ